MLWPVSPSLVRPRPLARALGVFRSNVYNSEKRGFLGESPMNTQNECFSDGMYRGTSVVWFV